MILQNTARKGKSAPSGLEREQRIIIAFPLPQQITILSTTYPYKYLYLSLGVSCEPPTCAGSCSLKLLASHYPLSDVPLATNIWPGRA